MNKKLPSPFDPITNMRAAMFGVTNPSDLPVYTDVVVVGKQERELPREKPSYFPRRQRNTK